MDYSRYDRRCPRCNHTFGAVSERGVCPECDLFFRCDPDGKLIGVINVAPSELDWPYDDPADELSQAVYETFQFGGGELFVSDRHEGYPSIALVHQQIKDTFEAIKASIADHLPDNAKHNDLDDKPPPSYEDSLSIDIISWDSGDHFCQLICRLTDQGGSIDAVLDRNADWMKGSSKPE